MTNNIKALTLTAEQTRFFEQCYPDTVVFHGVFHVNKQNLAVYRHKAKKGFWAIDADKNIRFSNRVLPYANTLNTFALYAPNSVRVSRRPSNDELYQQIVKPLGKGVNLVARQLSEIQAQSASNTQQAIKAGEGSRTFSEAALVITEGESFSVNGTKYRLVNNQPVRMIESGSVMTLNEMKPFFAAGDIISPQFVVDSVKADGTIEAHDNHGVQYKFNKEWDRVTFQYMGSQK